VQQDRELRMNPPVRNNIGPSYPCGDSIYVECGEGQVIRRSWDRVDTGVCRVTPTSREILFTINSFEKIDCEAALEARDFIGQYLARSAAASVSVAELSVECKSLAMGVKPQELDADPGKHLVVEFFPA
jgi:hypothetical protein